MLTSKRIFSIFWLLLFSVVNFLPALVTPVQAAALETSVPGVGDVSLELTLPLTGRPSNTESVSTSGSVNKVTTDKFTFPVVASGNGVPEDYGVVGQYGYAERNDNIGIVAHNYLEGWRFFSLGIGEHVTVKLKNGTTKVYEVYAYHTYQATNSDDFSKPFIDEYGQTLSPYEVFLASYKPGELTFQTCVLKDGNWSWGIVTIQARPIN